MSFLHITNQTEESADINLFSEIANGAAQSFVNEFNYLDSLGLQNINVRINSRGGDVFEGFGIVSAIRNATTNVTTINEGIAASTAGWILAVGDKRKAVDFSQTMAHNPSVNNEKASDSQKSMLAKIKESLVKIFTNNTGMDAAKVADLMNKTTFMNAKEALKAEEDAHKETKSELETAQNELKEIKKAKIEADVDNAIEAGKIKKEDKEKMLKIATDSPEAFNTIVGAVQVSDARPDKISNIVDNASKNEAKDDAKKDWTMRDYEKKDPTALNNMRLNDFDAYSVLFKNEYGTEPTK